MQVTVVANFAPGVLNKTITFQKPGDWYNYISSTNNRTGSTTEGLNGLTGSTFNLTTASQTIILGPGEYHIYVSGTPCTTAAPTALSPITYCQNAPATPLSATGSNLLWYTAASGGTGSAIAPTPSTATVGSTIYYVSQTITCEGPRLPITVNILASTPAPTVTSPVNYCQNTPASALTATGTNLKWYTTSTGGTGSSVAPTPSTTTLGSITYYVSQTLGSCGEGPRAGIIVNVNTVPGLPTISSPVNYCQNATSVALSATGTNLLWYTSSTGGTGTATAPTPSTSTIGSTIFYVSQTNNGCESQRASITVNISAVPAVPVVSSPVTFCQNTPASVLTATGSNLLWYTVATGGTGSSVAPTPPTTAVGSTNYYVSQTVVCESPRAIIVVDIVATTPAPVVVTPVNYCQNGIASALTATGTSLRWYTVATGGSGTSIAPVPLTGTTGSTTYYVSQTLSCGEGPRAAIVVTVNAIPGSPTVSGTVTYCQNSTATALTATGSNLTWYTTASGGTGSATAPIPITTNSGSTSYYVSQSVNNCESPRASIIVNITALPAAPASTNTVNYCQNEIATSLTATGTALLWYTVATGGTGSTTAPTPSTAAGGSTNYYVSQTVNGCEGPRTTISVNVTALPAAPSATNALSYCQNAVSIALTATGSGLKWYSVATGGTGTTTAPIPATSVAGVTNYYVSQSNVCGESQRTLIAVTITPTPSVATGLAVSSITTTGATISWVNVPGVFYTVEYKPSTSSTWINLASGVSNSSFNLSGLSLSTQYDWRVNANCASTIATDYATGQFTTSSRNTTISNFKNGIGIKISPNPSTNNSETILDYFVPDNGTVSILVYSSGGQRVKNISDGTRSPGQYQINMSQELRTLIHGTFIIRLEQNGKANSVKLVR
jgi:nitrous oxide reductase accessory protein NosL